MSVIGHGRLISFFENAIAQGTLSQSYCLVGPDGVGKKTLVKYLAASILGVKDEHLSTHPDFIIVSREEDEKTGKLKKDISIKQARELRGRLQHRTWLDGWRVVIIDEAELLNEESGNALLKVLEETRQRTVFFLLTTDDGALLATVRSRCQLFYLPLTPIREIKKGLEAMGFVEKLSAESAALSWGRPGRAIAIASDDGERRQYHNEIERWKKMIGAPYYFQLKEIEQVAGEKGDTIRTIDNLLGRLDVWIMIWRGVLYNGFGLKTESDFYGTEEFGKATAFDIIRLLGKMQEAKKFLRMNVNPRLAVESILLEI